MDENKVYMKVDMDAIEAAVRDEVQNLARDAFKSELSSNGYYGYKLKKGSHLKEPFDAKVEEAGLAAMEDLDLKKVAAQVVKKLVEDYKPTAAIKKKFKIKLDAAFNQYIEDLSEDAMKRIVVKKLSLIQ